MTTIITVHGTNDTSELDQGEQWWQKGSPFQTEIDALVRSSDGPIKWDVFHWDGRNSEKSRRRAGRNLFEKIYASHETGRGQDSEKYVLLGHSHGGSVIKAALEEAVLQDRPLKNLERWITVGTPFLEFRPSRWWHDYVGLPLKLLLVLSIIYLVGIFSIVFASPCDASSDLAGDCWRDIPRDLSIAEVDRVILSDPAELKEDGWIDDTDGPERLRLIVPKVTFTSSSALFQDEKDFDEQSTSSFNVSADSDGQLALDPVNQATFMKRVGLKQGYVNLCDPQNTQFLLIALREAVNPDRACDEWLKTASPDYFEGRIDSFDAEQDRKYEDGLEAEPVRIELLEFLIRKTSGREIGIATYFTYYPTLDILEVDSYPSEIPVYLRSYSVSTIALVGAVACLPSVLVLYWVWRIVRRRKRRLSKYTQRTFRDDYEQKWAGLYHANDEAQGIIHTAAKLKSKIAPDRLFAGTLAILIAIAVTALPFIVRLNVYFFDTLFEGNYFFQNLINDPLTYIREFYFFVGGWMTGAGDIGVGSGSQIILQMLGSIVFIALFGLVTLLIAGIIEDRIFNPLSKRLLNQNIDLAARSTAFGADVQGEKPFASSLVPLGFSHKLSPIAPDNAHAMDEYVTRYTAELVRKMRSFFGHSQRPDSSFNMDMIMETITWDELLHTSYFKVPEIQRLIADELIQTAILVSTDRSE